MAGHRQVIKVGILTVSDSCSAGKAVDKSGENLKSLVESGKYFRGSVVAKDIIPDEVKEIKAKLLHWSDQLKLDLILTTGGTGFAPRDVTPEATKAVLEKEAAGLTVAMIKGSLDITPKAMLTRLVCGSRGSTLIINLPGSTKGSAECLEIASVGIPHAVDLLNDRLSDVEKTHRQMIKQHNSRGKVDETAPLHEEIFQRTTNCSTQKTEGQGDIVGESGCLSQAYSMFKLIELLIRLAMPSIHRASAAYRILQSLSSSLSTIKTVASMQKTFDVWISALRSVMEASGSEAESNSDFQNSTPLKHTTFQATSLLKDQIDRDTSAISFPPSCFGEVHTMQHGNLRKASQGIARESYSTIGSDHVSFTEENLSFDTLQALSHCSTSQNDQPLKSTHSHLSKYFSPAKESRKIVQNKGACDNQPLLHNLFQSCLESKTNSHIDMSSTAVSSPFSSLAHECPYEINQSCSEKSVPCSEACANFKSMHEIQTLKESLMSVKTLKCNSEGSFPKSLSSQNVKKTNAHGTMANLPHHKKLLMDCGWRKQHNEEESSKCPLSDRSVYLKNKYGQNAYQNYLKLIVTSASDASPSQLEHPSTPNLRLKNALPSHLCSEQEIPSKMCQQSTSSTSSSCNNFDNETYHTQGGEKSSCNFRFDITRGIGCQDITSSNQNNEESISPLYCREKERLNHDVSAQQSICSLNNDSVNVRDIKSDSRNHLDVSAGLIEKATKDKLISDKQTNHKRSSPSNDIEQSSQISSSDVNIKLHPMGPAFKSAKIHNVRTRMHGELVYIPVGKAFMEFINEHVALKGINLYKGKRDIKKLLVRLCRQEDASSKTTSWKRGKEVLERNRFDDYFQLTHEGMKEQVQVHCGKKRDQYVVNWYMWCPGHGNCQRKCGGFGRCLENCKGMLHKQDRHNCSLMVNLKLFLSDLSLWRVHITGSHIPKENGTSIDFQGSNDRAVIQKRISIKSHVPHSANMANKTETTSDEKKGALEAMTPSLVVPSKPISFDSDTELAASKIPSKKRISRMLSSLKKRRKGRSYRSKAHMSDLKPFPMKVNSEASLFIIPNSGEEANNIENKRLCDVRQVDFPFTTNLCMDNGCVTIKRHVTVNRIQPESNDLPSVYYNPVTDMETCPTSHSIGSTVSFPLTTSTNRSYYNHSVDSYMNVQSDNDESAIWAAENAKGQSPTKEERQEEAMKMSFPYVSMSSVEDDLQQPFLHGNSLSDIFHQTNSDLPQQLEDFIDVMANTNWATESKHSENLNISSSPVSHSIPLCAENPGEIGTNDTYRIQCTSVAPSQILSGGLSASKQFSSLSMNILPASQLSTYSNAAKDSNPDVEATSLFQDEFYSQESMGPEVLPTYQEARAALGHQTSTENSYL